MDIEKVVQRKLVLRKLYKYSLDYNDGTAVGVHEHGYGDEATIDKIITKHLVDPYCEIDGDGWLVYQNEEEAAGSLAHKVLGKIEFWKEVEGYEDTTFEATSRE